MPAGFLSTIQNHTPQVGAPRFVLSICPDLPHDPRKMFTTTAETTNGNDPAAAALSRLRDRLGDVAPRWAMILGSGWGGVADAFEILQNIPYEDIPGLGRTGVAGHAGRLLLATHHAQPFLIFQGRRHWYEGAGWAPVALPLRLIHGMGIRTLILTNAAGGIRADLKPGDLMLIEDHLNAMGVNPLIGAHDPTWGPRFPDLSAVYDPDLRTLWMAAAEALGQPLARGVYLATSGPTYETPAEIRAYRAWGGDAVGMSTVPEAILAHAAGLRVTALSCITNLAAGVSPTPLSHAEVIAETDRAQPRMQALFREALSRLAARPDPPPNE